MPPIVTLTTDFGLADAYVAAMKAAILRHCPQAVLVDVTHLVPPQDVVAGSFALERAVAAFDAGTVHLAVVDPGVGSSRRLLVVQIAGQWIICPDNGLITWAWRRHRRGLARELTWRPGRVSSTFHGRDIMAPAAGMVAAGTEVAKLSKPLRKPVLLPLTVARPASRRGKVIYVDHYGNAVTNVVMDQATKRPSDGATKGGRGVRVVVRGRDVGPVRRTYSDVEPGEALALVGSAGLLEIAVRDGSAARELGICVGDVVRLVGE